MCKLLQITHKLNIKPFGLYSVCDSPELNHLHIDKIHKNKINSYNIGHQIARYSNCPRILKKSPETMECTVHTHNK